MVKKLLLVPAVLITAVLIYATTQPDSFVVERTVQINAAPEVVFPLMNDFHAWEQWSPWAAMDPEMVTTYSGAESGVGAVYEWKGNAKVGSGRMEIVSATVPSEVQIQLDFLSPFETHNRVLFSLMPNANGSEARWTMSGESNYMTKVMTSFVSMDKMMGGDFEKGLAELKRLAER